MKIKILFYSLTVSIMLFCVVSQNFMMYNATNLNPPTINTNYSLMPSTYTAHAPIIIDNDTQFASVITIGNGSQISPYIIDGWNITTSGSHGIYIHNTFAYFIIQNCWIKTNNLTSFNGIYLEDLAPGTAGLINNFCITNYNGIYVSNSQRVQIINNTCNNNGHTGISLDDNSLYSCIIDNTVNNNPYAGIFAGYSHHSIIDNNFCIKNGYFGIYCHWSENVTVSHNTCQESQDGIEFIGSHYSHLVLNFCSENGNGIRLFVTNTTILINNTCNRNNKGIFLDDADNCTLCGNILTLNSNYGIALCTYTYTMRNSIGNTIFLNTFRDNFVKPQGFDEGNNNIWYNMTTLQGNYWSEYSGSGSYLIAGPAGVHDMYPFILPDIYPPIITNIIITPSSPKPTDSISIKAQVGDASGVQEVFAFFNVNGGTMTMISMLHQNGENYQVLLGTYPNNTLIRFYIKATDNSMNHNIAINNNSGNYFSVYVVLYATPSTTFISSEDTNPISFTPLIINMFDLLFISVTLVIIKRKYVFFNNK